MSNTKITMPIDQDKFLKKAKGLTVETYNKLLPSAEKIAAAENITHVHGKYRREAMEITKDDVFIVWFSKTLQNWKALVSTTVPDDHLYFEITYNGDKKETYVDVYDKIHNIAIPDLD